MEFPDETMKRVLHVDFTNQFFFHQSRKLKMCALREYDVPVEITEIEQNKNRLDGVKPNRIEAMFEQSSIDKTTENGYVKAFTKMIEFEEAAQSQFLVQFNTKNIQLSHSESNAKQELYIKNNVRFNQQVIVLWICSFLHKFSLITHTVESGCNS